MKVSLLATVFIGASLYAVTSSGIAVRQPGVQHVSEGEITSGLAGLPLSFIPNRGQAPDALTHYAQGAGASVGFTARGPIISLPGEDAGLGVRFAGAEPTTPAARGKTDGIVSYFTGDREDWVTGLPTYSRMVYRDPWPGIDVRYSGTGSSLKYTAIVEPGADPAAVRMRLEGARGLSVNDDGQLEVATRAGTVVEDTPYVFQRIGGERVEVDSSYLVTGPTSYGFRLGDFDPSRPLVIDPTVLIYAGYIGGSLADGAFDVAVDSSGAAYVTGQSASQFAFPVTTTGALAETHNGGNDVFVAKVAPGGASLVYAGFLGGGFNESGNGIAIDSTGAAYIAGTVDDNSGFPTAGGGDTSDNGGTDAFVAKVAPDGASLVYSGFIGGTEDDSINDIALNTSDEAFVTGSTQDEDVTPTFPTTTGAFDETHNSDNGGFDAFVAKVATGGALVWATFIGGENSDGGTGIAVDGSGAYVTGGTSSSHTTFPDGTDDGDDDDAFDGILGFDTEYNGQGDAWVAKVAADGQSLLYASYLGGAPDTDGGGDIAVDGTGAAYVTGSTSSDEVVDPEPFDVPAFPAKVGPDTTYNLGTDAFVAKVAPGGTDLVYAGYIGGDDLDVGIGIAVDSGGAAYVTGMTESLQATFPETDGPDLDHNGGRDAFVAKVAPGGASLVYAGYIGGSMDDQGLEIAVDTAGAAYAVGETFSTEATFPEVVGPDLAKAGGADGFVAKIGEGDDDGDGNGNGDGDGNGNGGGGAAADTAACDQAEQKVKKAKAKLKKAKQGDNPAKVAKAKQKVKKAKGAAKAACSA